MNMSICDQCEEQTKKTRNGKPHDFLVKIDECRIFKGKNPGGFEEQDYQCLTCKARFTRSSNRNDLAWTLWRG